MTSVLVSGTAQEGQTLTATIQPAEATVTYKWLSSDAQSGSYSPISGATNKTYVLKASDVNKYIKCEATGTGKYSGIVTSQATAKVTDKPVAVTSVTISGTAKVGETLTATVAPGGATGAYQWEQADEAGGAYSNIAGATASTYQLKEAELNKFIKVKFVANGKYTGTVESEATAQVAAATP